MEKDPRVYIRHILEAIANIEADTAGYDFERFRLDRRARQLVERNLEILSEARPPPSQRAKRPGSAHSLASNRRHRQCPSTRIPRYVSNSSLGYLQEGSGTVESGGATHFRRNRHVGLAPVARRVSAAFFTAALCSDVIKCGTGLSWSGKEVEPDHL